MIILVYRNDEKIRNIIKKKKIKNKGVINSLEF